ncbi:kelch repeat-containing protein, partial [Acinetobacter baumannii]
LEGRIHIVGGSHSGRGNSTGHLVYDPEKDRWSEAAALPTPRDHLSVQAVAGKLVAAGGRIDGESNRNLAVTEVY